MSRGATFAAVEGHVARVMGQQRVVVEMKNLRMALLHIYRLLS